MTTCPHLTALDAWGDFDRDDPFPLFAQVRSAGPVHQVRLADGHQAWLVVGHDAAVAALNDPRLSKDMHAALARSGEIVAEGLPGPALARHMLSVDPPDHTRLRRLARPAFCGLLGIPDPDRDQLGRCFTTLLTPSPDPQPSAAAVAATAPISAWAHRWPGWRPGSR